MPFLNSASCVEYKDDSQIIPRSSSVIVSRRPSARPGKGKAAMYIAGTGNSSTGSDPATKHGGGPANNAPSWHKGAMSKRFDGKEEHSSSTAKSSVRLKPVLSIRLSALWLQSNLVNIKPSAVTNDDEAAAMAAMFQAQTANWEETQEKMTQLVSPIWFYCLCSRLNSHERDLFFFPCVSNLNSAVRIYTQPRGTGFARGGKPHAPHQHQHQYQPERPLPQSYVCYRCGQKGSPLFLA
jgi:protein MPE1